MSRRMTPDERAVKLRVGQRVRIVATGGRFSPLSVGLLADVLSVSEGGVWFTILSGAWTYQQHFTTADYPDRVLLQGDTIIKRIRGKPYVAGIDPPRAMGRLKKPKKGAGKRASAPPAPPAPPTHHSPTGEPPDMPTTATTAAMDSLTDLMVTSAYDRINKTLDPWKKEIEETITRRHDLLRSDFADVVVRERDKMLAKLKEEMDEVLEHATAIAPSPAAARSAPARRAGALRADTSNPIVAKLSSFYAPGVEAPANILLTSPPSFGKSFAIRTLGADYDVYLEHGCSDDMDEISTLLGSPVPDGKGNFIMVDGVLTEAVRGAAAGKTTLLLLDEVLRLTSRAQEWLLTFLTGVKKADGTRIYRLRTRRALPDGTLEVLECLSENLHIVGATNLSILSPIEAFWSRWETLRIEFSTEMAQSTASAILASYGIKDPRRRLAKAWASIVRDTRNVVADGKLRFPADFRMLERAAALSPDNSATSVARIALDRLTDNIANWNPDTGDTAPESLALAVTWTKKLAEVASEEPTSVATGEGG